MGTTMEITDKESFRATFNIDIKEPMMPWAEVRNKNSFEVT
jgi:hypothetical protein